MMQKSEKLLKPWQMGTHLTVLSESFQMNIQDDGLDGFQKYLPTCDSDESRLT